jgi:hypothetical protein
VSDQLLLYQLTASHGFGYVELHCEMQILLDTKHSTVVNFTPIVEVNFEWDVAVVNGSNHIRHASHDSVMSASSRLFVNVKYFRFKTKSSLCDLAFCTVSH